MILGIESSCDESALALFAPERGLVGEWVSSQVDLHRIYGGVVPDLASREHLDHFPHLLNALGREHDFAGIDGIAVTCGPGLAACLAMGVSVARSLELALRKPVCGVNHLRGHVYSVFIPVHAKAPREFRTRYSELLPHLGLLVSGGNTLLFALGENGAIDVLAETVDDAAGEALDKGAKLLGLAYPGGPLIEQAARRGNPSAYDFPRAFRSRNERRFSFSGLKTSLRYQLERMGDDEVRAHMDDLAASYQAAVIDALVLKTRQCLQSGNFRSLGLSGGVANNRTLRSRFAELAGDSGILFLPALSSHTGDNAAMIAFSAYLESGLREGKADASLEIRPVWRIT